MELDEYVTGIVVSPDLVLPSRSLGTSWGDNERTLNDLDQMQTAVAAVMNQYNTVIAALDAGFKQIETKQTADYRPLYLAAGGKPSMTPRRGRCLYPTRDHHPAQNRSVQHCGSGRSTQQNRPQ